MTLGGYRNKSSFWVSSHHQSSISNPYKITFQIRSFVFYFYFCPGYFNLFKHRVRACLLSQVEFSVGAHWNAKALSFPETISNLYNSAIAVKATWVPPPFILRCLWANACVNPVEFLLWVPEHMDYLAWRVHRSSTCLWLLYCPCFSPLISLNSSRDCINVLFRAEHSVITYYQCIVYP